MKRLLWIFLLAVPCFGQNARFDSVALGPRGPIPGATVAVCTQPANTSTQPCSPLANLCATLIDGVCGQPNPVTADSLGNYHFYLKITQTPVTVQIYGPQVASPFILPDQYVVAPLGGTAVVASLNRIVFCDQQAGATADVQIANAIAALPAAGGTVDCRGFGATTQTIAATTTVGSASKIVTLIVDRATFYQCTITNTSACWQVFPGSAIVGFGPGNSVGTTIGFGVSNAANVSNVIKAIAAGGTNRPLLDNIAIVSNGAATVSDSVVSLGDVLDGTSINNLSIGGYASTYLLKIVTASAASSGPTNINNVSLNCIAITGCKPLLVDSVANNAVLGGINFFGGSITHPGSGGLALATLQDTGGAGLNQGVNFYGTQFESSNAADIGVFCNGCRGLTMIGTLFTAGASVGTDCVRISGNAAGINLDNVNNFNGWTNTLNNQVNSTVLPASTTIISHYTYMRFTTTSNASWEDNTGNILRIDSSGVTVNRSGNAGLRIASGTAAMTTAAITAGNCGTTVTMAATGVATTDTITWAFNAAPAGSNAGLVAWPTANNVNFAYCSNTAQTPAAATINWRVVR